MDQYIQSIQAANILIEKQDFSNAVDKLKEALTFATHTEQKIDIFNTIGRLSLNMRQIEAAVEAFSQALELHQTLPEDKSKLLATNRAAILNNLGSIFMQHDIQQSIQYHTQALHIFETAVEESKDYQLHLANTHLSLGEVYYNKKDFYLSRKNYKLAIELYTSLETPNEKISKPLIANAYYNLANIATDENNTTVGREALTKALFLYQELTATSPQSFRPLLAATNNNLAVIAKLTDKYGDAIRYYLATLEQYDILIQESRAVFLPYYAATLNNLGIIYTQKHEVRDALGELETSGYTGFGMLSANSFKDDKKEEETRKDKEKAIKYYRQALDAYHELAQKEAEAYMPYIATTMHNLGILYDENKDYESAEDYYKNALKIRKELAQKDPQAFDADVCVTLLNMVTMNQSLMEQKADITYKAISLELLKEAQKRLEKYTDSRPIIKSMRSDIAYYSEYYKNVDEEYLEILYEFGLLDQLTEEITAVLDPKRKLPFQKEIHDRLLAISQKYPENDKLQKELFKSHVDYSWLAIRAKELKTAKTLIDQGLQLDGDKNLLNVNLGHYHVANNEQEKSTAIYDELIALKTGNFEKIIVDDLAILEKDGALEA